MSATQTPVTAQTTDPKSNNPDADPVSNSSLSAISDSSSNSSSNSSSSAKPAVSTTESTAGPTEPSGEPTTVPVKRKKKRKVRRVGVSKQKQEQMAGNERMVAWKLACRKMGYFQQTSFNRLPMRESDSWKLIWKARTQLLDKHWKKAARQTGLQKEYGHLTTEQIDKVKALTKRKKKVVEFTEDQAEEKGIYELMQSDKYKTVLTKQRELLVALYDRQRQTQAKRVEKAWEQALEEIGTKATIGDLATTSKGLRQQLTDKNWAEQYRRTKQRQKELLTVE